MYYLGNPVIYPPEGCDSEKLSGKNYFIESVGLYSASLLTSIKNLAMLQMSEHRSKDFDRLLSAVLRYNRNIGNEHPIKERERKIIYLTCGRGNRVNATDQGCATNEKVLIN